MGSWTGRPEYFIMMEWERQSLMMMTTRATPCHVEQELGLNFWCKREKIISSMNEYIVKKIMEGVSGRAGQLLCDTNSTTYFSFRCPAKTKGHKYPKFPVNYFRCCLTHRTWCSVCLHAQFPLFQIILHRHGFRGGGGAQGGAARLL